MKCTLPTIDSKFGIYKYNPWLTVNEMLIKYWQGNWNFYKWILQNKKLRRL